MLLEESPRNLEKKQDSFSETLPEWDLSPLYAGKDCPALQNAIQSALKKAVDFEKRWQDSLQNEAKNPSSGAIGLAVREYEEIYELIGRIGSFAELLYASNTLNPDYQKLCTDIEDIMTQANSHLLFFTLELNQLPKETIEILLENDSLLQAYKPWIAILRQGKKYELDTNLEKLFNEKSITAQSAWIRLFDETIASMEFTIAEEKLRLEPAMNKLRDKDETIRKEAAFSLQEKFRETIPLFSLITNTLAKDLDISNRWRSFDDVADFRHLSNQVERNVIEALVEAVQKSFSKTSQKYYCMKAKWLGMEKLNYWDRNAPLPESIERKISWKEAKEIVVSAYDRFCPKMGNIVQGFFDTKKIDACLRDGKAAGAFAHPTVPSLHPYILMNYMGKSDDVMTLAHELGHGIHQVLAAKQGYFMSSTPLTLGETASVFGELLTFRSLLDQISNPKERRILLAEKVEDMINTIIRQIAFYQFELKIHHERRKGEIPVKRISEIWLETQKESLGDGVCLEGGYDVFWASIPHFIHSPFYVYAYAFGNCLANCLYTTYTETKEGFVEKYTHMLEAGGKKHHSELLAPFGFKAYDPNFWLKGLSLLENMINELESIETC